jgi:hypothetical protein
MTSRDRLVVIVVSALAVVAAAWLLVVSPERKQAASLKAMVDAASAQVASADGEVADAHADRARYAAAYASVVSLGKAVPAGQEVPSLMYQIAQASNQKNVDFSSITAGGGSASAGSASPTAPAPGAAASASSSAASAGFTQMPFTFVFNGSFSDLYHLFQQLNRYTVRTTSGGLRVSGRLLTIQSTKLTPLTSSTTAGGGKATEQLTGTITATAYVLPATQGLTGGATPASPAGGVTTPVSSATTASSPTAPAVARVTP